MSKSRIYKTFLLHFVQVNGLKLSNLIIPLLQAIMFGMGSELSLFELSTVLKKPKGIIAGVICHYTIMPLVVFPLATLFNFSKEIAAGSADECNRFFTGHQVA
ncbi:MAG: hypothetical protein NVSMB7_13880 [Chitinophagaceae bacterium]